MENKVNIYFKQCAKYINRKDAPPSYHRFSNDGKITTISTARNTISFPSSLSIQKGFEIITQEVFEKVLEETLKGNNITNLPD